MRLPTLAALTLSVALPAAMYAEAADGHGKRSIVVFKDGVDVDAAVDDLQRTHKVGADHRYAAALKGFAGELGENKKAIAADPRVKYVVEDRILSLPPVRISGKTPSQPAPQPAQQIPTGVRRIHTLDNPIAQIDGSDLNIAVDVAVIDTGIHLSHPDLNVSNARQVSFVRGTKNANDDNGHGTHVAGTIGARDNTVGVVGVAPGVNLWAVKVLNSQGSGWTADIISGINYVADPARGIEIANMSLGGGVPIGPDPMHDAILGAVANGVVFVVAAGNSSKEATTSVPAAYGEVLTVSAIADYDGLMGGLGGTGTYGNDDTLATFSNFGAAVDVAAPGVDIRSTYKDGGYTSMSGTSMASPHVAGAVALYFATHPRATNASEVAAVIQTVLSRSAAENARIGDGFTGDRDQILEPLVNAATLSSTAN
ncbi:MAG: S8 family serine peptidase [Planctomycetes bacterium]|nr:S8 family serine peptidase [Planctomycetota bacterium]